MKLRSPSEELRTLKRFIGNLEKRFLRPHLATPALSPPGTQERLDVACIVVLTYGAIENFVEGLCLWALDRVERNWKTKKRASRCTVSLFLYQPALDDDMETSIGVYDNLRNALKRVKSDVSKQIEQNHGITPRHLRALFRPLGINVPEDPVLHASLNGLVALRHEWAHQSRFGARVVKSAKDVKATLDDCIALAEKLAKAAAEARP